MHLTIACNDKSYGDWTKNDNDNWEDSILDDWRRITESYYSSGCDTWRFHEESISKPNSPVSSDIPVLMINGAFDVATPAPLMWEQLEYLPNGWAFEFPGEGHFVSHHPCAHKIIKNFMAFPMNDPVDDCFSELLPPNFD